ncbi:MAG: hypothetical protein RL071_3404 [Pseudomonadota bacterium]
MSARTVPDPLPADPLIHRGTPQPNALHGRVRHPRAPMGVARLVWACLTLATACAGKGADDRADEADEADDQPDQGQPSAHTEGFGATSGTQPLDDGEDNDCDGLIDEPDEVEARPLFRTDGDEDGFQVGDPVASCLAPAGMAPFTGFGAPLDCDDSDPLVNPRSPENCEDAADEDCDGLRNCEDAECGMECVEDCEHDGDEDLDGLPDCEDDDCALRPACWTALSISLDGGGALAVNGVHTHRSFFYDTTASATLDLSAVQISGLGASGERRCTFEIPRLGLLQTFTRQSSPPFYGSSGWAGVIDAEPAVALSPDCPTPDLPALRGLDLGPNLDLRVRREAGAPLIRPIDGALVVGAGARWAPVGLRPGPLSASTRRVYTWFYFSHYHRTVSAQTATIDSFAPLE